MHGKTFASVALLVVLALTGCGGGSSTKTVTVAESGSAGTGQSAPSTTISEKQALQDFLGQFNTLRAQGKQASHKASQAIDDFNNNKTVDQLKQSGQVWNDSAKTIADVANQMAALTPPPSLADAYTGYVSYAQQLAETLRAAGKDAQQGDSTTVGQDFLALQSAANDASKFKVALIQQLTANGMSVPQWVKDMGNN